MNPAIPEQRKPPVGFILGSFQCSFPCLSRSSKANPSNPSGCGSRIGTQNGTLEKGNRD